MWSGPRNVSTAFMYSWRQRPDTLVFDEPWYGVYLTKFDPGHPGQDEIVATADLDHASIMAAITAEHPGRPVRYIKNIGHHLDALDVSILDAFTNVLLIRDPKSVIASLTATIGDSFSPDITGIVQQIRILDHELNAGREPLVIDSADLLADPAGMLRAVCDRVGIVHDDSMLSWPAGPKPEDGIWAQHWYHNAHASTGFGDPTRRNVELNVRQQALFDAVASHHERLWAHRIQLDG